MTNQHTPAPWRHEPGRDGKPPYVVRGSEGGFVVMGMAAERQEADAALIAAAPELLEALEVVLHLCHVIKAPDGPALDKARAAIAKARGSQ